MKKNEPSTNRAYASSALSPIAAFCLCTLLSACSFNPNDPVADAADLTVSDASIYSDASIFADSATPPEVPDSAVDVAVGAFFVESTAPQSGAENIELGSSIKVEFSLPVDPSSLTDSSLRLVDETSATIPINIATEGATVTVTPMAPLTLLTSFKLEISPEAKSTSGLNLQAAFATTLRTRDGVWSLPFQLSDLGEDLRQPVVATDDSGKTMVVWSVVTPAFFPTRGTILAAWIAPGVGWSAPVTLNGPDDLSAFPSMAMRDGRAWAVWRTFKDNRVQVVAAEYNGQQWLPPTPITTPANHELRELHVVALSGGRALTVWEQKDGSLPHREVKASLFADGAWQTPVLLNPVQTPVRPQVVAVGRGAAVAWQTYDANNDIDVTLRTFDGMAWKPTTPLNVGIKWPGTLRELRLAPDNLGGVSAIWARWPSTEGLSPKGSSVQLAQTKDGVAMPLTDLRGFETGNFVDEVATATSDAGAPMAMWCQGGGCWFAINTSGAWATSGLGEAARWASPVVHRDPRNNGMVGWLRRVDEKTTLNFRRVVAGKLDSKEPEAFPKQQDNAWYPSLSIGPKGNAAMAWVENSSSSGGISTSGKLWVRVFE